MHPERWQTDVCSRTLACIPLEKSCQAGDRERGTELSHSPRTPASANPWITNVTARHDCLSAHCLGRRGKFRTNQLTQPPTPHGVLPIFCRSASLAGVLAMASWSSSRLSDNPRGEGRPVRRRTRTFRPNYLSFAGTYQCNLTCPHCCVPIEWPDRLGHRRRPCASWKTPTPTASTSSASPAASRSSIRSSCLALCRRGRRAGLPLRQGHDQRRLARATPPTWKRC